jgi:tRNA(Ile)-lysidine synthetase-like protein
MLELLANNNPNVTYNLGKNFALIKVYKTFYIEQLTTNKTQFLEINSVGEYIISKEIKFLLSKSPIELHNSRVFEYSYKNNPFPLFIRNRQAGDRMELRVGTKKIKDIFIDQKVPALERDTLLLLANQDRVLWIPGIKEAKKDESYTDKLYIYEVKTC